MNSYLEDNLGDEWISASSTYNYMMKDPLLDWLKYHHDSLSTKKRKYYKIIHRALSNNTCNSFNNYIMEQGNIFEQKVINFLISKLGSQNIINLHGSLHSRSSKKFQDTLEAMKKGVPIIYSGVLHNPQNKTFGVPDLLVRSDWLKYLVKNSPITSEIEKKKARKLSSGNPWHYRVVDIKFTTLLLTSDGIHVLNTSSFPAYKAQLLIYNWALGFHQGYTPDQTYILGRRWKYTSNREIIYGNSCFDRLGTIDYSSFDSKYITLTQKAIQWIREVRSEEASNWNVTNYPLDRWELYPNMCNYHDFPWRELKQTLANDTKELTSLWMVGPKNRNFAINSGVYQWTDPNCNTEVLGINGENTSRILSKIIEVNQSNELILPCFIKNNIGDWKSKEGVEFYVDFEVYNGILHENTLHTDCQKNSNIIFLIGIGYLDPITNYWKYQSFYCRNISYREERRICREFYTFVKKISIDHHVHRVKCIHWSNIEQRLWFSVLERSRILYNMWKEWSWEWLDLLKIFKTEPIVINGCMSFSLKQVAKTMKNHGLISTIWDKDNECIDGTSVIVAINKIYQNNKDSDYIIKSIIDYNQVDVRVLYEIITYLRENHCKETRGIKRKLSNENNINKKRRLN